MSGIRLPRMYAIVDAAQTASPADVTASLLAAGVRLIQYRDKSSSSRQVYEMSRKMAGEIALAGGTFIVNDRADVALAAGAHGVHVGQADLPARLVRQFFPPDKIVGVSTHSIAQVAAADREPVDYIAFGPVFQTQSKANPDPQVGLEGLAEARKATRKPLVAIGGITLDNARSVILAGADSIAVIRELLSAPDAGEQARRFIEIIGD
ncbi:MAG: thiamine phosphate synthase [Acidobacteriota bacterium]|nr:thiamine phosphate synthase [Acidobacteriota bacterium]